MNQACFTKTRICTYNKLRASSPAKVGQSIRTIKNNFVRMKSYVSLILLFFLLGCIEKMNLESFDFDNKLVVNAFLTPDSIVSIYIANTQRIDDGSYTDFINNLQVEIEQEGTHILTNYGNGLYRGNFYPLQNKEYKLTINNNSQSIISFETVPISTEIGNCYFVYPAGIEEIRYEDGVITEGEVAEGYLTFIDDYKENNYYELALFQRIYKFEGNQQTGKWDTVSFSFQSVRIIGSDDFIIQAEGLNDYKPRSLLFSDALFNGKVVAFAFRFPPYLLYNSEFYCVLRTVSRNYYLYKKSLVKHLYNKGMTETDDFQELTKFTVGAEPVELYSNIEHGYGIFASYSSSVKLMEFKNRRTE